MRRTLSIALAVLLAGSFWAATAMAGAKLKINDDSVIDLGFRLQSLYISANNIDLDGDGEFDRKDDFRVRRGRLRLKGVINEYTSCFLQTDVGSGTGGSGLDWRLIDAFVTLSPNDWFQIYSGINMAPASRQNLTSSGVLLAIDRPGMTYRSLNWGTRSVTSFNSGLSIGSPGLGGDVNVRDTGVTVFGSGPVGDDASFKYYIGTYDGLQAAGEDNERYTVRGQLNFFDAEGGYYNSSNYLGKKKTVGIGVGLDTQSAIGATDDGTLVDYTHVSGDFFAEWPVADGSLSFEAGYTALDFSEDVLDHDGDGGATTAEKALRGTRGNGFYVQAGFFFEEQWQPWVEFEQWNSVSGDDVGAYNLVRAGVTYYMRGQNANIKAGVEQVSLQGSNTFTSGGDDSITTFVLGAYVTY